MVDWRIYEHPILEFDRGPEMTIYLDGRPLKAFSNETVSAALYANGVRVLSKSIKYHRPRGFFCGIGNCSGCMMEIDGIPNVKTCVVKVRDGMRIKRQNTLADHLAPLLNRLNLSPMTYIKMFTKPMTNTLLRTKAIETITFILRNRFFIFSSLGKKVY